MPFWKAKETPKHQTLTGRHLGEEVASALPNFSPTFYVERESEESQHIRSLFPENAQGDAVVVIGSTCFYTQTVSVLTTHTTPIIFFQTSFLDATRLLPQGVPLPALSVFDTAFYGNEEDVQRGLVHLLSLGISCDKGLFDLVYSSFTLEKLLTRVTPMLLHMRTSEDEGSRIRSRLTFGHTIATALYDLAQGELTYEEALSCGMIWEARMGLRAGRVPLRLYQDLEGVISYLNLPSHYDIPPEEVEAYFRTRLTSDDIITLHLPKKKGTLAPYSLSLESFLSLLLQCQN